jgi:ferredoxin
VVLLNDPTVIVVDQDRCVGSSICISIAGEVFALSDDGQAYVRDPAGADLETILEAAEGCPTTAITIRSRETGEVLFPRF